jgi:phenylpropionate dioxygenase-like ring-hydroxylating dioxygenase large terminal subunit
VFGEKRRDAKIRIKIYGEEKDFFQAQRLSVWHIISETGVYNPFWNHIIVHKWSRFLPTCFHEASHAVYNHYALFRPSWIDEGLAEYFKTATFDSLGEVHFHVNNYRRADMKKFVSDSAFTIREVLRASARKFHGKNSTFFYSTGWGIVYFLRTKHDAVFSRILLSVSRGIRSAKVIEQEYPGGVLQLEKDLVAFYR